MTLSVRLLLDWIFKMRGLWSSYTVSEIASALNISRATIYRYIDQRKQRVKKTSKKIVI